MSGRGAIMSGNMSEILLQAFDFAGHCKYVRFQMDTPTYFRVSGAFCVTRTQARDVGILKFFIIFDINNILYTNPLILHGSNMSDRVLAYLILAYCLTYCPR